MASPRRHGVILTGPRNGGLPSGPARGSMLDLARGALYPVLPLRDIVVFPHMIVPLFVGREKSVRALEDVMQDDKQILLRHAEKRGAGRPDARRYYTLGTIGTVLQILKLPDGTVKVLVEGVQRARVARFTDNAEFLPGVRGARSSETRRRAGKKLEALCATVVAPVRAIHQAQQENPAGGAGLDQPDRRSSQARRYDRLASAAQDSREAGTARDRLSSPSGWSRFSALWKARSACSRSKSASAAASSARWRRPSASII